MPGTIKVISWNLQNFGSYDLLDSTVVGPTVLGILQYADIVAIMELLSFSGSISADSIKLLNDLRHTLHTNDPGAGWTSFYSESNTTSGDQDGCAVLFKTSPAQSNYPSTNNQKTVNKITLENNEIRIVNKDTKGNTLTFKGPRTYKQGNSIVTKVVEWRKPGFCRFNIESGGNKKDLGLMIYHANSPQNNPKASIWRAKELKEFKEEGNFIFVSDTNIDMSEETRKIDYNFSELPLLDTKESGKDFYDAVKKKVEINVLIGDARANAGIKTSLKKSAGASSLECRSAAYDNMLVRFQNNDFVSASILPNANNKEYEENGVIDVIQKIHVHLKSPASPNPKLQTALDRFLCIHRVIAGKGKKRLREGEKSPGISDHLPIYQYFTMQ